MGLRSWLGLTQADVEPIEIEADSPFGGTTVDGGPISGFSDSLVDAIRTDAYQGGSPGNAYALQVAVRICVDYLARNMAHLNLKTFQRTDETPLPVRDHPLAQLIQRPNPRTTRYQMIYDLLADRLTYDDAYLWKAFKGDARQLHRLPPYLITPRGGDIITGPDHYEMATTSGPRDFQPEEILHFHGYNPWDNRVGLSILRALRTVLLEESEASRWRSESWKKGPQHEGVVERPSTAKWSPNGRKRFREYLREHSRGSRFTAEPLVLEDDMTWKQSGFSPKDTEFMAGREWALDLVATAFGIPLALLSRKDTATFASLQVFRKVLYTDVLGPWSAEIEGTFNLQLVPEFGEDDLYVEFNIDEKLQGDFEEQSRAARESVQVPWMSVNAMLKKRGEPPVGDPDDPENPYNTPARPINYQYGPQPDPETEPATAPEEETPVLRAVPAAETDLRLTDAELRKLGGSSEDFMELLLAKAGEETAEP